MVRSSCRLGQLECRLEQGDRLGRTAGGHVGGGEIIAAFECAGISGPNSRVRPSAAEPQRGPQYFLVDPAPVPHQVARRL